MAPGAVTSRVKKEIPTLDVVMLLRENDLSFDARVKREAGALAAAGYSVTVLARKSDSTPLVEERDGYRVERLPDALVQLDASLVERAVELKPRVIHAHDLKGLVLGRQAKRHCDAKLVYDSHELWSGFHGLETAPTSKDRRNGRVEARSIAAADRIITVSDACAEFLKRRYGREDVTVVRNISEISTVTESLDLHAEVGLDETWRLVVYMGADTVRARGLQSGLEAVAGMERTALVLVGPEPQGRGKKLLDWAAERGFGDRLHLLGMQPLPRALALIAGADVALCLHEPVSESARASLPNKLFQYAVAGVPVVASDLPDISTVVQRYSLGTLVDPTQPDAIREAIDGLLDDPEARPRLESMRDLMRQEISWDRESTRLVNLYSELLGPGSAMVDAPAVSLQSHVPLPGRYRLEVVFSRSRRGRKRWSSKAAFERWVGEALREQHPAAEVDSGASQSLLVVDDGPTVKSCFQIFGAVMGSRPERLWVALEDHWYDMSARTKARLMLAPVLRASWQLRYFS